MSLVTTCPACATAFRVVPDQLKVAEGWVRCGECSEVFDARGALEDEEGDAAPAPAGSASPALVAATAEYEPLLTAKPEPEPEPVADAPFDLDASPGLSAPLEPAAPLEPESPLEPEASLEPALEPVHGSPTEIERELADARSRPPDLLLDEPLLRLQAELPDGLLAGASVAPAALVPKTGISTAAAADESASPDPGPQELDFMRDPRQGSGGRTPAVRAVLGLATAVLLVLLAGQFALHHRDALAALHPPLTPALRILCAPLDCQVGVPRAIESIVIDSSGFTRVRSDAFRLGVTLRNQAPTPVQVPALELTLTDADDRPVLRRVLRPQDLGPVPGAIAAGGDWTAAATLAVDANGMAARITGYRLLAFYP